MRHSFKKYDRKYSTKKQQVKNALKWIAITGAISYALLSGRTYESTSKRTGFEPDGTNVHTDFNPKPTICEYQKINRYLYKQ